MTVGTINLQYAHLSLDELATDTECNKDCLNFTQCLRINNKYLQHVSTLFRICQSDSMLSVDNTRDLKQCGVLSLQKKQKKKIAMMYLPVPLECSRVV